VAERHGTEDCEPVIRREWLIASAWVSGAITNLTPNVDARAS
jgi:hypothetical protein